MPIYTDGSTPNYTVVGTALTRALERSGSDAATDTVVTTELLQLSSVKTSSTSTPVSATLYRPFLVAALLLEQRQLTLVSGDGAVFRRTLGEADKLRQLQAGMDADQGAVIGTNLGALEYGRNAASSLGDVVGWY